MTMTESRGTDTSSSWTARARRLPRHDVFIGAVALLAVFAVSGTLTSYYLYVVTVVVIFTLVGASHTVLFGAAGQPSVGHAAILGCGAYTAITIARETPLGLEVSLPLGAVVGALVGAGMGLSSLRVGSLYLAIATLALSVAGVRLFTEWESLTGGGAGIEVEPPSLFGVLYNPLGLLWIALAATAVLLWTTRNLLRGRSGRAWNALRTSPLAAASVGISAGFQKSVAFAVSGALTGVAGVLYAHAVNFVSPADFGVNLAITMLVIAILGGQRYLWGAALGSAFVQGTPELLEPVGEYRDIIFGGIFILVMLFLPDGFMGAVAKLVQRTRAGAPAQGEGTSGLGAERLVPSAAERSAPSPKNAGTAGARVEIRELRIAFGGVRAIDGADLTVEPGSVVGLIGPNGAGKTTLLNGISGFVRPTAGRLLIDGRDYLGRRAYKRRETGIARTFQNLNLHDGLTVREHLLIGQHSCAEYGFWSQLLRLPRFARGEAALQARADEVLRATGLDQLAEVRVDDLPYGVQKRVDIARAIAARPRLLLLDEPAAGLTPDEASELLDRVLRICREDGTTVVLVEHNIELVMRSTDRVVALNFGRVIAEGTPEVVRNDRDFVEAYLGS